MTSTTAWEHARSWAPLDLDAARAADRIRQEVRQRYGVDVDAPGGDPTRVREALEARGVALEASNTERRQADLEQAEAVGLLQAADRADRGARERQQPTERASTLQGAGEQLYDSAGRREALAASLIGVADAEATRARALSDVSQGRPASDSLLETAPGRRLSARKQRAKAIGPRAHGSLGK